MMELNEIEVVSGRRAREPLPSDLVAVMAMLALALAFILVMRRVGGRIFRSLPFRRRKWSQT